MIDDLANFNTIQKTEITQGKFSDHNAMKLETSNQRVTRKFRQVWSEHHAEDRWQQKARPERQRHYGRTSGGCSH